MLAPLFVLQHVRLHVLCQQSGGLLVPTRTIESRTFVSATIARIVAMLHQAVPSSLELHMSLAPSAGFICRGLACCGGSLLLSAERGRVDVLCFLVLP